MCTRNNFELLCDLTKNKPFFKEALSSFFQYWIIIRLFRGQIDREICHVVDIWDLPLYI